MLTGTKEKGYENAGEGWARRTASQQLLVIFVESLDERHERVVVIPRLIHRRQEGRCRHAPKPAG